METFNIYCDESCHLEHDNQRTMVLGALCSKTLDARKISKAIKALKIKHALSPTFEIKWTKVSPAKIDFYSDLLHYFYNEPTLRFRALIVPDKLQLRHDNFNQDHDTWYYKMFYRLLEAMLHSSDRYRIYLDNKDTKSGEKVKTLHHILSDNYGNVIDKIQNVRSHEIEQIQLVDLLIGCVLGANRGTSSPAKQHLIDTMSQFFTHDKKIDIFRWSAREVHHD